MAAARRQRSSSGEFERLSREPSLEERIDRAVQDRERERDTASDWLDVPATVVCAFCGDADCSGCENDLSRSGVVSVVAWEREASPVMSRLWSTARSTTRDAEGFFELLPDGPITPALRFAAICELLASAIWFFIFLVTAGLVAPEWLKHLALDAQARSITLRIMFLGLPAFAGLLIVAHVAHGLSINWGATRQGARNARSRALRFGLYACGWDLVMGPIGLVIVAIKEGSKAAANLPGSLNGLPTRATNAFLRGCYRLDGQRARSALGTSYVGATLATVGFAFVVLIALTALALS